MLALITLYATKNSYKANVTSNVTDDIPDDSNDLSAAHSRLGTFATILRHSRLDETLVRRQARN